MNEADVDVLVDSVLVEPRPPPPAKPYGAPLMLPQFATEAVLRGWLLELGHAVELGVALECLDQDGDTERPPAVRCPSRCGWCGARQHTPARTAIPAAQALCRWPPALVRKDRSTGAPCDDAAS